MIDDEIEQVFDYSNGGGHSHIPEETYFSREYGIDNRAIKIELVKAYVDAFNERFEGETGIALNAVFETMTSPREYNFETDRVFVDVPIATVNALFTESEKDKHVKLTTVIKDQCTSYDGFYSYYSNDLGQWLLKPLLTWDHNELGILLQAVAAIHCDTAWCVGDLLESWVVNGRLSNAVWGAMPAKLQEFAEVQREYGEAVDFALWVDTGKAYPEGLTEDEIKDIEPLPEPRCTETIEMRF